MRGIAKWAAFSSSGVAGVAPFGGDQHGYAKATDGTHEHREQKMLATIVVAKWTGELDEARLHAELNSETWIEAQEPEELVNARDAHMPLGHAS